MKKIFVAIDGSEHAWKALDYAAELAKGMKCSLFVYTALKPSDSGALLIDFISMRVESPFRAA